MKSITLRLLAGFLSSLVLPVIVLVSISVGKGETGDVESGFITAGFIFYYSAPVFLVAGSLFSWAIDYLGSALRLPAGIISYITKLLLYAVAGSLSLLLYLAILTGGEFKTSEDVEGISYIGAVASLTYYHIWLLLQKLFGLGKKTYIPPAPIETERLLLIPCTSETLREAVEQGYHAGDHITWYMSQLERDPEWLGWGTWLVKLLENGRFAGDSGFKGKPTADGRVEIGYGFLPYERGKGYGTETAKALVEWAFKQGVNQVIAETERTNEASMNVLKKLDFTKYHETEKFYYWQLYKRG